MNTGIIKVVVSVFLFFLSEMPTSKIWRLFILHYSSNPPPPHTPLNVNSPTKPPCPQIDPAAMAKDIIWSLA